MGLNHNYLVNYWMDSDQSYCKFDDVENRWMDYHRSYLESHCKDWNRSYYIHRIHRIRHILELWIKEVFNDVKCRCSHEKKSFLPNWRDFLTSCTGFPFSDATSIFEGGAGAGRDLQFTIAALPSTINITTNIAFIFLNSNETLHKFVYWKHFSKWNNQQNSVIRSSFRILYSTFFYSSQFE